ncbi:hypothetical protein ACLBWT_14030 [Paenibacillus sp. D51F]
MEEALAKKHGPCKRAAEKGIAAREVTENVSLQTEIILPIAVVPSFL